MNLIPGVFYYSKINFVMQGPLHPFQKNENIYFIMLDEIKYNFNSSKGNKIYLLKYTQ